MKKYRKENRMWYALSLICIFVSNLFAVVLQFYKGDVLDYAIQGNKSATITSAVLLIAFILVEVLFYFAFNLSSSKYIVACTHSLRQDIFTSILRRSYVSFKEKTIGEYIAKYTNEVDTIKALHFSLLPTFWDVLFKIVFVSIALFYLDWRIALVTLALLTTPLYIPKLIEKQLQRTQAEQIKAVERNLEKVNNWLSGFEVIKNFSIEKKIIEMFDESNSLSAKKMMDNQFIGSVSQLITTLISYVSYFVVLTCATYLVLIGEFTAGSFFVAIGMIDQLSYPLISLAEIIRQLIAVKPVRSSLDNFLNESSNTNSGDSLSKFQSNIMLRGVNFSYDATMPVLQDVDFEIKKGKRYLLKGPSGCGKTTFVNLLLRYYNTNSGAIRIDGIPIENYQSTYDCITVVRQEASLFCDTLRNNLAMYQDVPDDKLVDLLNRLGLDKYATMHGLDTFIEENGANLSGGEKKRISLGRALLRDTDILILDEPLANLDVDTAQKIEELLLEITDKTLIVVSHQFSDDKLSAFYQVYDFENK